jgi:hypothetical protein
MMRPSFLCAATTSSAVLALILLIPIDLAAQTSSPSNLKTRAQVQPPRTPDKKPDLSGIWNFSNAVPLERPKELSGKQVLTAEEAAAFERQLADTRRANDSTSETAPVGSRTGYEQAIWFEQGNRLLGNRTSLIIDPPDGKIPALAPEAQKKRQAAADARKGIGTDEPTPGGFVEDLGPRGLTVRCILGFNAGPPMTPGQYNNHVQIFQTPDYVVLLTEMIHDARIIPIDGRPHGKLRQWAGDSRGRWDGDTLVIDTVNFHRPTIVMTSLETSATMRLVERFRRVDADTLLYEFTIEDPTTWTKPWTAQMPMQRSENPVYEYACHEGNYGLPNILSGAAK